MAKEPLYPHVPKKKEPLFPHTPAGQQAAGPLTVRFWDGTAKTAKDRDEAIRLVKEGLDGWMEKGDRIEWHWGAESDDYVAFATVFTREGGLTDASAKILYGSQARGTEKQKHYWVEKNLPYDSWAIVEAFPGGTVRSPFDTKEEAIKREEQIAEAYEWKAKLVPSPQEKFPKQHEALKKLYPYKFVEYHDDGDLTIQLLQETFPGSHQLEPAQSIVVTTDGRTFKESDLTPSTKEAWQMTRAEYEASLLARRPHMTSIERLQFKQHSRIVKEALSEGKPVPPEVLAEYPYLDIEGILRTDPGLIVEKYALPTGKAMPRTPQQSARLIELAIRASEGARQIAITEHHPAWKVVDRLEGLMNDEEFTEYNQQRGTQLDLLARTEGDPISKYCCSQCGECSPAELLEEGRFLDRITWLREHYEEKHPGMWGEMSPMTIADGGLVKPEHRRLLDLVDEPLPPDAY